MKQTIIIIIIVAALAGAGIFAYMSFFSNGSSSLVTFGEDTGAPGTSEILPLGSNLNFDQIHKFNKDSRVFQYPSVNPSEIGPVMGTMVK